MREPGLPSLDQLRVFVAVVDCGGFAYAARQLQRTQSVISYTIANLEQQLNVVLLDRSKRKPALTEAGKALLADARAVSLKVDGLRARAQALAGGLEGEVTLAVDVLFPTSVLADALATFQREFPTVLLRLHTDTPGAVAQLVLERACQFGIGDMTGSGDTLQRHAVGHVTLLAVAAPRHPLAQLPGPLSAALLREHTQLVLSKHHPQPAGPDVGLPAPRDWHLGDLASQHELLRAGLGWGQMPAALVRDDLAAGRLLKLTLADGAPLAYPLHVMHRADAAPGQAGRWLMKLFSEKLPTLLKHGY